MEPTFPAAHALHLVELVKRWDIAPQELVGGLDVERLADPAERLRVVELEEIIERARRLTGEAGIGFFLGLQMQVSAHGQLGFAAMTAKSVREALSAAERFAPTRTTALSLEVRERAQQTELVIHERADLGRARDVVLVALAVGIWRIGCALTGRELSGSADFAFEEPEYFARFASASPGNVRCGQPENRLVFATEILDLPLTMSDEAARRLAVRHCEAELDALGYERQLVGRARALLPNGEVGFRTLDELAQELGMSPRTLRRKLAAHGSSYSELLDAERRDRAMLLLRNDAFSIEQVAERVGYADLANFTRAFRRWVGMTPAAFRKSATLLND